MNKAHKTVIIFYGLIVILGASIPFILNWEEPITWTLEIINTTSILMASGLALVYFDPFEIRKGNLKRQHQNVIKILEATSSQRICAHSKSPDQKKYSEVHSQTFLTKQQLDFALSKKGLPAEHLDCSLLINLQNFTQENEKLVGFKNNLFTPKSISQKMNFLEFGYATQAGKHNYFSIAIWGGFDSKVDEEKLCERLDGEATSLRIILQKYQDLIQECITWLEQNSFSTKHLNIQ